MFKYAPKLTADSDATPWLFDNQIAILRDFFECAISSYPSRNVILAGNIDISTAVHDGVFLTEVSNEALGRLSSGDLAGALAWGRVSYVAQRRVAHAWLAFLHIALAAGQLRHSGLRAPKENALATDANPSIIPQTIMQYWDRLPPPPDVQKLILSWTAVPNYTHCLINDNEARSFLKTYFNLSVYEAYDIVPHVAGRADLFRLAWLARHGGIYSDVDDYLTGDLTRLLPEDAGLVLNWSGTDMPCINNWFFAVRPDHPLIWSQLRLAVSHVLQMRGNDAAPPVWVLTGPGATTMCLLDAVCAGLETAALLADVRLHTEQDFRQIVCDGTDLLQYKTDPASNWRLA